MSLLLNGFSFQMMCIASDDRKNLSAKVLKLDKNIATATETTKANLSRSEEK